MIDTLYKKDQTGNTRIWTIEVTETSGVANIHIESGILNGKLVSQDTEITEGKNIGKANETTPYQQALSEAESKVKMQIKDSYVYDVNNLKDATTKGSGAKAAMLAQTYDPKGKTKGGKNFKQLKFEQHKLLGIQRKYDGFRLLTHLTRTAISLFMRSGDQTFNLPHIEKTLLAKVNDVFDILNIEELWLDGEAYAHGPSFNEISSIIRNGPKTSEDAIKSQQIEYHIYDVITDDGYEIRSQLLKHFVGGCIKAVQTIWIENATEDILQEHMETFLGDKYEGLIIRIPGKPYEPKKRTWNLLKYKPWEDSEFVGVRLVEGVEKGKCATIECRPDQPCFDRNGKPIEFFYPTFVGTDEEAAWAWEHSKEYEGKQITVKYIGRSEYGIPRNPTVKGVRLDI